jgi:hypothetical protein
MSELHCAQLTRCIMPFVVGAARQLLGSCSRGRLCSAQVLRHIALGMPKIKSHCEAAANVTLAAVLARVPQHLEVLSLSSILAGVAVQREPIFTDNIISGI